MNKKLKGFSLAELLISLLIISIVLSAAIPTLTKRSGANREYIWKWANENNSAYFGNGDNQSAIIGFDRNPLQVMTKDENSITTTDEKVGGSIASILADEKFSNDETNLRENIKAVDLSNITFSKDGDRLILFKKPDEKKDSNNNNSVLSNFTNSHISFYTTTNRNPTTADIKYAGKITLDPDNIAIGKGVLQNQKLTANGENTAVGHFALLRNDSGKRNTAIGIKTLSFNEYGGYNTALGFGSLFELGALDAPTGVNNGYRGSGFGFDNTAVGAMSQQYNNVGQQNTSVGAHSLRNLQYIENSNSVIAGDANTAVGFAALNKLKNGDDNAGFGSSACVGLVEGSHNICVGANSGYSEIRGGAKTHLTIDNYGVYIGSSPLLEDTSGIYADGAAPLISGHSRKTTSTFSNGDTKTFDQELNVNAKQVVFRPFNAGFDAFKFESIVGTDGYRSGNSDPEKGQRWARATFNLRDTWSGAPPSSSTDKTSVALSFYGVGGMGDKTGVNSKTLVIDALDPAWQKLAGDNPSANIDNYLADISFNKMLTFSFPKADPTGERNPAPAIEISGHNIPALAAENHYPIVFNHVMAFVPPEVSPQDNKTFPIPSLSLKSTATTNATSKYNFDNKIKGEIGIDNNAKTSGITFSQEADSNEFKFKQTKNGKIEIEQTNNGFFQVKQGDGENAPIIQMSPAQAYFTGAAKMNINAQGALDITGGEGSKLQFGGTSVTTSDVCNASGKCLSQIGSTSSDIRLKNISGDNIAGLKEINALEVKNYTYKDDKEKTPHVGVIAQQIQKIFPNAVTKDKDGYLRIRTEDIFYAMVNSIKDLFKQVQDLAAKVTGLDKRLTELETQNKLLQQQNKLLQKQNKAIEKRLAKLEKKAAK